MMWRGGVEGYKPRLGLNVTTAAQPSCVVCYNSAIGSPFYTANDSKYGSMLYGLYGIAPLPSRPNRFQFSLWTGWLAGRLTSLCSTKVGYICDKVSGGDLVPPGYLAELNLHLRPWSLISQPTNLLIS